ncbi:MAG: DUF1707 domain-containing protein [Geodermatophilaceae bacterium]
MGDREREQAVTHLGTAFAEGRLDLAEYDERVASAYGAKTASDLLHLTADLPLATREHPAQPAAGAASQATPRNQEAGRLSRIGPGTQVAYPGWLRVAWLTYAAAVSINLVIWLIVSVSTAEPGVLLADVGRRPVGCDPGFPYPRLPDGAGFEAARTKPTLGPA